MTHGPAPTCDRGPGYCRDCGGCARLLAWQVGLDPTEQDHFARWVRASHTDRYGQIDMLTAIVDPTLEWPATVDDLYTDFDRFIAAWNDLGDAVVDELSAWLDRWLPSRR